MRNFAILGTQKAVVNRKFTEFREIEIKKPGASESEQKDCSNPFTPGTGFVTRYY